MLASYVKSLRATFVLAVYLGLCCNTYAQSGGSSTTLNGTVVDQSGAVVPNAAVEIHNPVSGFVRTTVTDNSGKFSIPNVPFNPYHFTVTAQGFAVYAQDVDVRSLVSMNLSISLRVESSSETVTVESTGQDLLENDPTFHTDVDRGLFDKLPLESASSSLSSLVTLATPGIAADSNGLFHGLGDHAENSFSLDGQPITDQQSKIFSNQVPLDTVQSLEVIAGAPPRGIRGQDQRGDQRHHPIRPGHDQPSWRHHRFLRQLWHVQCGPQLRVRRAEVGKLRRGERPEQWKISRPA